MSTQTVSEMKAHITDKAAKDGDFRAELVRDPKAVISSELGVLIPENFAVHVHEDNAATAHMVLPMSDRLTEEDLAQIAGGGWGQDSMDQLEEDMNNP